VSRQNKSHALCSIYNVLDDCCVLTCVSFIIMLLKLNVFQCMKKVLYKYGI